MANEMGTVKVVLSGFPGGPGLMQFRFQGGTPGVFNGADATAAIAAVWAFITAIKSAFSGATTAQVQSDVEVSDWTTGTLTSIVSGTGVTVVVGTGTLAALTAEGPLVQWRTSTVVAGRLLRGRSFIVPSSSGNLAVNGQLQPTTVTFLQAAGAALIATAAVTFSMWHRPSSGGGAPVGTVGAVVTCTVPLTVAVLRSRRD